MDKNTSKWSSIAKKKRRIRKNIEGDHDRPRLSVYRSESHIYGQIINDFDGRTLVAVSSVSKELKEKFINIKPIEVARLVGEALADAAVKAGIQKVVFDRNGRRYSGRIQALAEAARSKGLQF